MTFYPLLFQPFRLGTLQLRNRLVMAPLGTNLADVNGAVSKPLLDWYRERAWGGVGLVIVENASADDRFGRGLAHQIRLTDPKYTPGLAQLAETIKEAGAKAAIQINIQGGGIDPDLSPGVQPVGPSSVSYIFDSSGTNFGLPARMKKPKTLRALTKEEIGELRKSFIRAATIARSAGFDAIELHGAHGYLLAAFLSPAANQRNDEYGGSVANRFRFIREVYEGIRERVGNDFPIIFRFSGQEYYRGGREIGESQLIAQMLEEIGIDALHVSAGISMLAEAYSWVNPPASFPPAPFIQDAAAIKQVVKIPVIGVGKINSPELAEQILKDEKADLIALGRPLIADPEWPQKVREGRKQDIRPCLYCNRCLRIMYRQPIRCTVNARAGRESEFSLLPASRPRKIAVVGGGPAGLEAACVAAERGHQVTLFEKEKILGGQLRLAIVPPYKKELSGFLAYLRRQVRKKAKVELNCEISAEELVRQGFEAAVIATGCSPPDLSFAHEKVSRAWDILLNKVKVSGSAVVIIGSSRVSCETAEFLSARRQKSVTIVHSGSMDTLGQGMEPIFERPLLLERLLKAEVKIILHTKFHEITEGGVSLKGEFTGIIPCDHVVFEDPPISQTELFSTLQGKMEVKMVGDCVEPRDLYAAIHEGFIAGYRL
ncbi:MAG: FAD-dependent oxidoreductase [bacterium]